jgi:chromosome segregation ATPase
MLFSTKLKQQIEELTAKAAEATERASAFQAQATAMADKLKAAEEENGRLDAELGAKDADLAAAKDELEKVQAELAETKAKLAARVEDVRRAFAAELANGATKEARDGASEGHPAALPENGAETSAETWADALTAEGGDYAKARQLHPAAFAAAFPGVAKNLESKNGD